MMILIEDTDFQSIENLVERAEETGPKNYLIRGIFAQAEKKNGNGRSYPFPIMEREVKGLCEGKIAQGRLVGELGHPNSIEIGLDRVSHKITSLKFDKHDVMGEALIGDTPCGKIAKALIDMDVKLGVSTRGVGTLKEMIVQNDFRMKTIDIVADPSAPDAFVSAVLENNSEWVLENGILVEKEVQVIKGEIDTIIVENPFSVEDRQAGLLQLFGRVLEGISSKLVTEKRLISGIHITYLDGNTKKKIFVPHDVAKQYHNDAHDRAAREYVRKNFPGSNMKRVTQVTRGFQTPS
jgi:hypothetical protein